MIYEVMFRIKGVKWKTGLKKCLMNKQLENYRKVVELKFGLQ